MLQSGLQQALTIGIFAVLIATLGLLATPILAVFLYRLAVRLPSESVSRPLRPVRLRVGWLSWLVVAVCITFSTVSRNYIAEEDFQFLLDHLAKRYALLMPNSKDLAPKIFGIQFHLSSQLVFLVADLLQLLCFTFLYRNPSVIRARMGVLDTNFASASKFRTAFLAIGFIACILGVYLLFYHKNSALPIILSHTIFSTWLYVHFSFSLIEFALLAILLTSKSAKKFARSKESL